MRGFDCGIHNVAYRATQAGCPVCEAERDIKQMRAALKEVNGKLRVLSEENNKLRIQTDIVASIRQAASLLEDDDLMFLKEVLYQWRDEKSLGLKTTHGTRRGRRRAAANGFIVMPRKGEPYGYACTSMGGIAIAQYFEEATNAVGPAQAMTYLSRGMAEHLPGSAR